MAERRFDGKVALVTERPRVSAGPRCAAGREGARVFGHE